MKSFLAPVIPCTLIEIILLSVNTSLSLNAPNDANTFSLGIRISLTIFSPSLLSIAFNLIGT